jgi:hypothetical protein
LGRPEPPRARAEPERRLLLLLLLGLAEGAEGGGGGLGGRAKPLGLGGTSEGERRGGRGRRAKRERAPGRGLCAEGGGLRGLAEPSQLGWLLLRLLSEHAARGARRGPKRTLLRLLAEPSRGSKPSRRRGRLAETKRRGGRGGLPEAGRRLSEQSPSGARRCASKGGR